MNSLLEFLRSRRSIVFIALGALVLIFSLAPSCQSKKRPARSASPPAPTGNDSSNLHFILPRPTPAVIPTPPRVESAARTNKTPILYSVHVDLPAETNTAARTDVAPFGRLLQCQLVNTLESLAPNTPIIGLVTEPLWQQGQLLIPAGTEVHGPAQLDRVRERITSNGPWNLIWQTGEHLAVTGIALDRELAANGSGWGITDGSAGIRGELLRSGTLPEIKLFLATALSGVARGLQQTRSTPFGDVLSGTARNVGLASSGQAIDAYAQRILEAIQRDGLYVRVAAGKQFYVYVTEPIDRSKARSTGGGSTVSASSTPATR